MQIYIDESGTFVPVVGNRPSVSVMAALVVPSANREKLFARWKTLRSTFPKNKAGEVKGSLLNEQQVSKVCELLRRNACLVELAAIDGAREDVAEIKRHQARQAEAITENLTDAHQPTMIAELWSLRRTLEDMAAQLYLQSTIASNMICDLLTILPTYFVQRWPHDVAEFRWTIDAKDSNKITEYESWWSTVIAPLLQSASRRKPMIYCEGLDYSAFDAKFLRPTPAYLLPHGFANESGVDIGKIMRENFEFSARVEPGLELVDIIANATRRAFNGNLRANGWVDIPRLAISRSTPAISFLTLGQARDIPSTTSYLPLLRGAFKRGGRALLTP